MRKTAILCLVLLVSLMLPSCSRDVRAEHCEIGIKLNRDFEKIETDGAFDLSYASDDIIVGISRLSFAAAVADGVPATLDPESFAAVYMSRSGHKEEVLQYGEVPYYTYKVKTDTGSLTYLATFYKSPYAYFVITFITKSTGGAYIEDMLALTNGVYLILE